MKIRELTIYLLAALFPVMFISCNSESTETETQTEEAATAAITNNVEAYYFHFTRRCATCNAVEDVTKEALNEYFADAMDSEKIVFKSVNLDEESSEEIAGKLNVAEQSLLFVSGDEQVNLTSDAFMYARSAPDKLKAKVKETIEEFQK